MMPSTAEFKRVFIDTSVWIDLMKSSERHHAAAVTFHKSLSPMTLRITSWGIVSETFTWIRLSHRLPGSCALALPEGYAGESGLPSSGLSRLPHGTWSAKGH